MEQKHLIGLLVWKFLIGNHLNLCLVNKESNRIFFMGKETETPILIIVNS